MNNLLFIIVIIIIVNTLRTKCSLGLVDNGVLLFDEDPDLLEGRFSRLIRASVPFSRGEISPLCGDDGSFSKDKMRFIIFELQLQSSGRINKQYIYYEFRFLNPDPANFSK